MADGPPARARLSNEARTCKDTCQCLCTKDRLFIVSAVVCADSPGAER